MRRWSVRCALILMTLSVNTGLMVTASADDKVRLLLVDSYHRDYLWCKYTHAGFAEALLKRGYLDTQEQIDELWKSDQVESSKAIVKVLWMDTKRKNSKPEMQQATMQLTEEVKAFRPALFFLAEDNAANYIGNQFLDAELPSVLWRINNTLAKYGLVVARNILVITSLGSWSLSTSLKAYSS